VLGVSGGDEEHPPSLWNLIIERPRGWLEVSRQPSSAVFSPDERFVALLSMGTRHPRRRPTVTIFRTDTASVVYRTSVDRLRRRRDTSRVSEEGERYFLEPRAVFSSSGYYVLIGPFGMRRGCRYPFEVRDTRRWRLVGTICTGAENAAMALSDDGRIAAMGTATRLDIFDMSRPDEPRRVPGVESNLGLQISAYGRWLGVESWEGVRLVEVPTGRVNADCELRPHSISSDDAEHQLVVSPRMERSVVRPALAFSPDGRTFAAAAEHLCLFHLTGPEPRLERRDLPFPADSVRFGPHGLELALVERFVSGYVLAVYDTRDWTVRYSAPTAFLHPGRPRVDDVVGWQVCGPVCPAGLELGCFEIDRGSLESGRCRLSCRDGDAQPPGTRCVAPMVPSLTPFLERLTTSEDSTVRWRAEHHLERLRGLGQ